MPFYDRVKRVWCCSWLCGFEDKDADKIVEHENEKHGARFKRNLNYIQVGE